MSSLTRIKITHQPIIYENKKVFVFVAYLALKDINNVHFVRSLRHIYVYFNYLLLKRFTSIQIFGVYISLVSHLYL